ncbi:hypothetical protein NL676_025698 [Syzygium grande]|nr:hypothetical protein NL676_025698 [Syzygium grande]
MVDSFIIAIALFFKTDKSNRTESAIERTKGHRFLAPLRTKYHLTNTTNAIDNGAKLERTITIPELSRAVGVPKRRRRRRSDKEVRSFSNVASEVRKSASSQQASTVFPRRPLISSSCRSFQFSISTSHVGEECVNEG